MDPSTMVDMIEGSENEKLWQHRIRRKEATGNPKRFEELRKQEKAEVQDDANDFIAQLNQAASIGDVTETTHTAEQNTDSEPIDFSDISGETDIKAVQSSGRTIVLQNVHVEKLTIHL